MGNSRLYSSDTATSSAATASCQGVEKQWDVALIRQASISTLCSGGKMLLSIVLVCCYISFFKATIHDSLSAGIPGVPVCCCTRYRICRVANMGATKATCMSVRP